MISPDTIKKLLSENKLFFISYLIFLITGILYFCFCSQGCLSLWLNSHHTWYLDEFFRYVTYIGDGIGSIIICVILLFVSYRFTLFGVISYITSGVFAQVIKYIFQTPRPKIYYEHSNIILNFVSGVSVYSFNSFPSGHATSAFSIFLILAVITKNKSLGLVYFLMAFIVGLSRIYLLQHFFIDVYFGSIIGIIFAMITILIMSRSDKISSSKSLDNSIMMFFRK